MKRVFLSEGASHELVRYLEMRGYQVNTVRKHENIRTPVTAHPDIYMCALGNGIFTGDPEALTDRYPGDVLYNAAAVGRYFICSRHTSPILMEAACGSSKGGSPGLTPVIVPQGYVKCNLVVVDDRRVITEDAGIARVLAAETDIECLLVSPHQVALPGYSYGFIGGASGRVGNEIIFNGDLTAHSCAGEITAFIENAGLSVRSFPWRLTDIGSIIADK